MNTTATVRFDGGTSCNIPRLGYGLGYGSYQIDDQPIVRLDFYEAMSANCAEIRTLASAVMSAKAAGHRDLVILGDSQIALKWANVAAGNRKATKLKGVSDGFRSAINHLHAAMVGIVSVRTRWTPREQSVAIFGH